MVLAECGPGGGARGVTRDAGRRVARLAGRVRRSYGDGGDGERCGFR